MKVKEIYVSKSRTVNLGNYESEKVTVGVTVTVGDNQGEEEIYEEASEFVEEKLKQEVEAIG